MIKLPADENISKKTRITELGLRIRGFIPVICITRRKETLDWYT